MKTNVKIIAGAVIALFFLSGSGYAQETGKGSFCSVEALGGWGQANIKDKKDYHFLPFFVDFDFDIKKWSRDNEPHPRQPMLQFQVEPFFSYVLEPNSGNIEVGNNFLLKAGIFPGDWAFQPYIRAGVGGIYMSQHIAEQPAHLNFTECAAVGAQYSFDKRTSFIAEVRGRHVSNAGLKKPNRSISGWLTLCGVDLKF